MPVDTGFYTTIQSIMNLFLGGQDPKATYALLLKEFSRYTNNLSETGETYSAPRSGSLATLVGGTSGGGANVGVNREAESSGLDTHSNNITSQEASLKNTSLPGQTVDCAIYVKPGDEPKIYGHTVVEADNTSGFGDNTPAIYIPHIIINNVKIASQHIHEMYIDLKGFIPTGYVVVEEGTQKDVPGERNHITIIASPVHSNSNRKIWIPGYIKEGLRQREYQYADPEKKYIKYTFRASYEGLEQSKASVDGFYRTYDYIRKIALDAGLGFASGPKVEDVKDARLRWSSGNTGYNLIQNELERGGLGSENTVFKGWIDAYGYVNIVNIHYLMHNIDNVSQLNIDTGPHITSVDLPGPQLHTVKSYPVLTNMDMQEPANNHIVDYRWKIDHFDTANYGNSIQLIVQKANTGDGPKIQELDLQVSGNDFASADPNGAEKKWPAKYLGEEQSELPVMLQKEISEFYDRKLNQTHFELTLERPNFDLLRGMQVKVFIVEKNNLYANKLKPDPSRTLDELGDPVVSPQNTFVGYINGMEFTYDAREPQTLKQKLFLIPLTPIVPLAAIVNIPTDGGDTETFVSAKGSNPTKGIEPILDKTANIDPES